MAGIGLSGINTNIFTQSVTNTGVVDKNSLESTDSRVDFSDVMKDAINKVNESQINANDKIEGLIKGEDVTMHDIMIAVQESQMSMQLMLEVRNKIFDAYKEVSGVQL